MKNKLTKINQSTLGKESKISAKELTAKVNTLLLKRYDRPEWATFFEVCHGETMCRADFIAFNLFPSRNFKILGFEVKASRGDWQKELRNGKKADYFVGQCDEWYIVQAYDGIVKIDELPKGWGLKTMKGDRLYTKVHSKIEYKPVPKREFFVRMIEKSQDSIKNKCMLYEAERRGYREGQNDKISSDFRTNRLKEKAGIVDKLEEKGLYLWLMSDAKLKSMITVMKIIDNLEGWGMKGALESITKDVERITETADKCHNFLKEIEGVNVK